MNIWDIENRVRELANKTVWTDEEEFEIIEKLQLLIEKKKDYRDAEYLGGIYYGNKQYNLALKYYELAETLGSRWAWNGLGYIWYYGRTGHVDYEKAFKYFSKVVNDEKSDNEYDKAEAQFKLADMYKNGYYVEKNWDKYIEMIEDLYDKVKNHYYMPRPEVFTRLASIRTLQGRSDEAVDLYLSAKRDLIERVADNRFFGDLNRIKWLVNDLYKLIDFDRTEFDLFDLYYLLKDEHVVTFEIDNEKHTIESRRDGNEMNIRFDDKWYRNIDDFFIKAVIGDESIEAYYWDMVNWEVVE